MLEIAYALTSIGLAATIGAIVMVVNVIRGL